MKDPFPIPPIPWLAKAVQPLSDILSFQTLELHVHEVVISFLSYTAINLYFAPLVSRWLVPERYDKLSPEKKLSWNVHVVSLCQSTMINTLALWVMYVDEERKNMDWRQRVWGYTGAAGMVQGLAAGYFLWDLVITLQHVKVFGPGMLAHALSALCVFSFSFRPFVNFYGCTFILYELSSPFLNFHWFFDKLNMTGSRPQLINGILLLITFFSCRLVWGTYQSVRVYQDVWTALHHTPVLSPSAGVQPDAFNSTAAALGESGMMRFAGDESVPVWLAVTYLGSNVILNTLNFYWFGKMIEAVRKRFTGPVSKEKAGTKKVTQNGRRKITADETEVRRRRVKA